MWSGTYEYLTTYNGKLKKYDTNYEEDVNQIKKLGLNAISGDTWLASRRVDSNSSQTEFCVRVLDTSNNELRCMLIKLGAGHSEYGSGEFGVRPVFLLLSDVVISRGDGSKDNPYVIE